MCSQISEGVEEISSQNKQTVSSLSISSRSVQSALKILKLEDNASRNLPLHIMIMLDLHTILIDVYTLGQTSLWFRKIIDDIKLIIKSVHCIDFKMLFFAQVSMKHG